jgi:hypothetical protein
VIDELETMRREHALIYFDSVSQPEFTDWRKAQNNSAGIQTRNILIAK